MVKNYNSVVARQVSDTTTSWNHEEKTNPTKKRNLITFVAVVLALFSSALSQAQSTANYAFSTNTTGSLALDSNGNAVDMSAGTTPLVAAASDQGVSPVTNIGFNYVFFGNTFSQFTVSANGLMQLGATPVLGNTYITSDGTANAPKISAISADAATASLLDGGGVTSKLIGTAPNRCLVVQWVSYLWWNNNPIPTSPATFQVRLYETTGVIEYVYGAMQVVTGFTGTTGFSSGLLTNQIASITTSTNAVSYATPFAANVYPAATNIPNLHSTANGSRRVYTFTPPNQVLGDATSLTFTAVGANTTTVNWVDNATNESAFVILRATDAAFSQNLFLTTVPSTTSAGTGSAYSSVQTGLSSGTNYFYRVRAAVEAGQSTGILGNQATLNGATYYYTGLNGGSWNTFANWNTAADGTGSIPTAWATSDIHVLDGAGTTAGGTLAIAVDRVSFTIGQIKITNNTDVTLASDSATTRIITISGGPNEDFIVEVGSNLNLISAANAIAFAFSGIGNTGTIAGNYTASGSNSNVITTTGGTGTLLTVTSSGTITNNINSTSATIVGSITSLLFENLSNYVHATSTTTNYIPTATWQANATATLRGNTTGTNLVSSSPILGNLIVNTTLSTTTLSAFAANTRTIQGDLIVNSTGTGRFRAVTSGILTINGNLIVNAGILEGASATGLILVKGSTIVAPGATLDLNRAVLQNEGNMVNNGSVLSSETTTVNSTINFLGTAGLAQTFSGSGTFTGRISSFGVSNPLGLTLSTPVLAQRVNLFSGLLTGSANITLGTGLALPGAVQIGTAANTTSGGSFDVAPTFNLGTGTYSVLYLGETTPRTTGLEIPTTRSITTLILDNLNGLNISGGTIEVTNGLTLTNGIITSTLANHIIHGSVTAAGILTGGSATSYISGPIVRTINDANTAYVLFPVGKTQYAPVFLAPTTTSVSRFRAETFPTNTGTADASIANLATNRRWEAPLVTGTYTNINVRIGDANLIATNIPVHSTTAAGQYSSAFGSTATFVAGTPNTIQSNFSVNSANYLGFLSYATSNACAGTPTPGATTTTSNSLCLGDTVTLGITTVPAGSGITYQWQSSIDGTTFTDIVGATAFSYVVTPTAVTSYRVNVTCTTGSVTATSTPIQITFANNITATTPGTRCGSGTVSLAATGSTGTTLNWYAAATGGTSLATGSTFVTPSITSTTDFYVDASVGSGITTLGPVSPTAQGGTIGTQTVAWNINFTVTQATQLTSVDVFPLTSGQTSAIALRDASGAVISTVNFTTTVSGGATAQIVPLNFVLTPGNYQLFPTLPSSGVSRNITGAVYPYTSSVANITGNGFDANYFMGMYNWKFGTSCNSPRVKVIATVTTAPALTLSTSTVTICNASTSAAVTLTAGATDYDTFVWAPAAGVSGNSTTGWTFNPTTTTNYVLTASQSAGSLCATTANFSVTVNPIPTAITFSPTAPMACINSVLPLNANGGSLSNATILTENFNATTNAWTTVNNTTGGTPANAAWTLRPNNYAYSTYAAWQSNDNSQFYLSNSDAAGSGSTTNTLLQSPAFSTSNFTAVNLKFFNYLYEPSAASTTAKVQASLDGTTWVDLQTITATTTNAATTFTEVTVPLTAAFINQAIVFVRFSYAGAWRYFWGIDNVSVSGTQNTNITWSPVTNLFTDAAATVPYTTGTSASAVFVKSATAGATTYTATATTAIGCSVSNTVSVMINQTAAPTATSPQSFVAPATIADIVVSGTGTVTWYATLADANATTNALATTTALVDNTTYYATLTSNGCPSTAVAVLVNVTLGNNSFDNKALSYYPNPTKNTMTIEYSNLITNLKVTNMLGQVVSDKKQNASSVQLDLSNMAAGTYIVEITSQNLVKQIKVVKAD